jgi:N-acetylglucosamine kinase-like BadF-type ATPase
MQLIADSGSTKASWRAIHDDGSVVEMETEGINPVFMKGEQIERILNEQIVPIIGRDVESVSFYSAGAVGGEASAKLERCFGRVFRDAKLECVSDVLAAARALCGHKPGIACILGTGSNSCFYDGEGVAQNVRAGGFILGDEASGAYLGKRLISDFIKGLLPPAIEKELIRRYDLDYMTIVQRVYREEMPSRFLASFSPFISEFKNHPHMANLLKNSFEEFLRRNIIHYDYKKYPINFVGSVAYYYKDILEKVVNAAGMRMGVVIQRPIDGLVEYHKNTK